MNARCIAIGALVATGCTPTETDACSGGGDTSAAIGTEEIVGQFVPYDDGDDVPVNNGQPPTLEFAYEVTGLDANDDVTIVLRLARDGDTATTDYVDTIQMRCAEPGPARAGAEAPWPATWPGPEALDGTPITVDTVFTDVHEASADVTVELLVDWGP